MKITFPHMGNIHIVLKSLLEGLNLEVVSPPPITKRTYELGTKNSPEFACMPLKINVGNYIEAIEKGADTVIMAGGWGPCRFGYYAQVEREILKDLEYNFEMVVLEAPDSKWGDLLQQLKSLGENVSLWTALKAAKFAWDKLNAIENMERSLEYYLPRVSEKEEAEKIYEKALLSIDKSLKRQEINGIVNSAVKDMSLLSKHNKHVLKIGLLGEVYTILEPAANYDICRKLGYLNVEIERSVYLSEWVNDHLFGGLAKKSRHKKIIESARPYLNYWVGGHGQETVGYAVDFARHNFDGVIQVGPLTCMPEIVAQSILPEVSKNEGIPVMTLWFDELSGTAGIYTRVEAFVDMIQRQKTDENLIREA